MSIPYRPPPWSGTIRAWPLNVAVCVWASSEVGGEAAVLFTATVSRRGKVIVRSIGHTEDEAVKTAWSLYQRWEKAHANECDPLRN